MEIMTIIINNFEYHCRSIVLSLFIITVLLIACRLNKQNQSYYRVGFVNIDSLVLSNRNILLKGQLVQIIQDKSTEEGTFIKVKNDSDKVYYKYISTICWLKQGKTINSINDTDLLILNRVQAGKVIVNTISGKEFIFNEGDIVYDNQKVYNDIIK